MLPFKKILWPTDFSEPSLKALEAAEEMARHFFAELHLVHVVPPVPVVIGQNPGAPTPFSPEKYEQQLAEAGQHSLKKLSEEKVWEDLKVQHHVARGQPADEIVRVAEEVGADLIVIATHGTTGWRRLVFGSVAGKVVQAADCCVMTIRAGC